MDETSMLRKLRVKFIALIMASVACVLLISFTAICVVEHNRSTSEVYAALENAVNLAAGEGKRANMGDMSGIADIGAATGATNTDELGGISGIGPAVGFAQSPGENPGEGFSGKLEADAGADDAASDMAPPEIGGKRGRGIEPLAVYAVQDDGNVAPVSNLTTASIANDVLDEALACVLEASEQTGYLEELGLFYAQQQVRGARYIAFADAGAASSWKSLALTLTGAGAAALAAFFVISVFFSRWALRPVEDAWRQQRQFIADASHELKTPLTVILANTAILRQHANRTVASQSQWVEGTQLEAERMQGLVRDMLDLAQPTGARPVIQMEPLNLSDLTEGCLLQFESVAFERNIHLNSEIDTNIMFEGSSQRLQRLVSTLLDNACKYADANGSVTVKLQQKVRCIKLLVQNSGKPIPPEDLPHVFDRFYRADKARSGTEGSYGLGLAIAREIAEEHGGSIEVASTLDSGTVFTVTFPLP